MAPRILVVGNTMIDLIAYADGLPDDGQTVVGTSFVMGSAARARTRRSRPPGSGPRSRWSIVGDDSHGTRPREPVLRASTTT